MTIESVLTQLESLHAASTQEEWEVTTEFIPDPNGPEMYVASSGKQLPCSYGGMLHLPECPEQIWKDAEFIAAAHNHLPAVIAEVRRLQLTEAGMKRVIDIASRKLELQHADVERMRDALTTIVDRADRTDIGWWAVSPYAYEVAKAALGESK